MTYTQLYKYFGIKLMFVPRNQHYFRCFLLHAVEVPCNHQIYSRALQRKIKRTETQFPKWKIK